MIELSAPMRLLTTNDDRPLPRASHSPSDAVGPSFQEVLGSKRAGGGRSPSISHATDRETPDHSRKLEPEADNNQAIRSEMTSMPVVPVTIVAPSDPIFQPLLDHLGDGVENGEVIGSKAIASSGESPIDEPSLFGSDPIAQDEGAHTGTGSLPMKGTPGSPSPDGLDVKKRQDAHGPEHRPAQSIRKDVTQAPPATIHTKGAGRTAPFFYGTTRQRITPATQSMQLLQSMIDPTGRTSADGGFPRGLTGERPGDVLWTTLPEEAAHGLDGGGERARHVIMDEYHGDGASVLGVDDGMVVTLLTETEHETPRMTEVFSAELNRGTAARQKDGSDSFSTDVGRANHFSSVWNPKVQGPGENRGTTGLRDDLKPHVFDPRQAEGIPEEGMPRNDHFRVPLASSEPKHFNPSAIVDQKALAGVDRVEDSRPFSNESELSWMALADSSSGGNHLSFNGVRGVPTDMTSTPLTETTEMNLDQLIRYAEARIDGDEGHITIQLRPSHLGELELNITAEQGVLSAKFVAQSLEVKALIESSLPQLRESLEQHGMDVAELSVSVGDAHGGQQQSPHHDLSGHESLPAGSPIPSHRAQTDTEPAAEPARSVIGPDGVDVWA